MTLFFKPYRRAKLCLIAVFFSGVPRPHAVQICNMVRVRECAWCGAADTRGAQLAEDAQHRRASAAAREARSIVQRDALLHVEPISGSGADAFAILISVRRLDSPNQTMSAPP